jgi:hypothetical protein
MCIIILFKIELKIKYIFENIVIVLFKTTPLFRKERQKWSI